MSLISLYYLLFILLVAIAFRFLNAQQRLLLITIASLIFIGFHSWFSVIFILISSCTNFYFGKYLSINKNKNIFITAILTNTFFLFLFKYFHFSKGLNLGAANFQISSIAVALGISYYTLQNIAYLIETYNDRIKPVTNVFQFISFNAFFPKVTSGPIESPKKFLQTLGNLNNSSQKDWAYGLQRIGIGFFKKMVIADRLAPLVSRTFELDGPSQGFTAWVGVCLFTVQLYFDFSGYIDIAIGSARLLGIRLTENFNLPFRATSISEFWRRWHITLFEWIKLYLYLPVVYYFRSYKKWSVIAGLAIVFLLSGFWHGLGLTFLTWACLHILFITYEVLTKQKRKKFANKISKYFYIPASIFITFNLVCFSELFFRSSSMSSAYLLLKRIFVLPFFPKDWTADFWAPLIGGGSQEHLFNIYCTFVLFIGFILFEKKIYKNAVSENLNIMVWLVLLIVFFVFCIFESGEEFIYLQF